jgi:hypothetical protein
VAVIPKLSEIDWTAIVGSVIALAFCVLVLFPGFETWSAHQEAQYQAAQSAPPISATDAAALAVAYYTKVLAWFTAVLAIVSTFQLWLLRRSEDTANKMATIALTQTVAAHRPILKVRHVRVETDAAPAFWTANDLVKGSLVVVNSGGTRADIIGSGLRVYFGNDVLPMVDPTGVKVLPFIVLPVSLAAGDSCHIPFSGTPEVEAGQDKNTFMILKDKDSRGYFMYVIGHIKYRDMDGNGRFMGFCRRWNGRGTFIAVDNSDYEYND